jgi:prepilin-type N-terminal cleavage/methylation domain-containing protein
MQLDTRGFTLIELLVVIAIVGLLSSVVLVSVKNARNRAIDNSIKSNLLTVRSQSGIYYDKFGNYDDFLDFINSPNEVQIIAVNAACNASGVACTTLSDPNGWYVVVSLKSKPGFSWCVDYLGNSKEVITGATNLNDPFACA